MLVLRWVLVVIALALSACSGVREKAASAAVAPSAPPEAPAPEEGYPYSFSAGVELDSLSVDKSTARVERAFKGAPARGLPAGATAALEAPPHPPSEGANEPQAQRSVPDAATGPLLIYTAQVHLAVYEMQKARDAAEKLIRDSKGYLVQQNDTSITFRVPAENFHGTFEAVLKLGDVLLRNINVKDITEEFFDLQTRLQTLELMRKRMEELLARAQNVQDALAVERELERLVSQIEQLKGKLKFFRELVAFSTITIQFQARSVETLKQGAELPFPWLKELGLGQLLSL